MGKLRIGMIGCGRISGLHSLGYRHHAGAEIYAVCDSRPELAAIQAKEWGAAEVYADYRQLLDDPAVDAVEILTPQATHESIILAAAEAQKHILVQKPMTIDLDSAKRIAAKVQKQHRVFKVMENYLFYPPIVRAKEWLDQGMIGELVGLRFKFISGQSGGWHVPAEAWAWRKQESQAGRGMQTFDHGHHLWAVAWHLGGEIERVKAWIDSRDGLVDCPATVMWKYHSGRPGAIVHGVCDYTHAYELELPSDYYANDEWFEITGSKGMILIHRCTGKLKDGPILSIYTNSQGWRHLDEIPSDWSCGFIGATQNFIAAIEGREPPLLNCQQASSVLKIACSIRRSAEQGCEVCLAEWD